MGYSTWSVRDFNEKNLTMVITELSAFYVINIRTGDIKEKRIDCFTKTKQI